MNLNASSDWPECTLKASKNYQTSFGSSCPKNPTCNMCSLLQYWTNNFKLFIKSNTKSTFSVFGLMHLIKWGLAAVILSIRIAKEVFHKRKIACITLTLILRQKSKVALSDLLRDLRLLFGFTTDIHRQFMICNNTNPNHQINIWKQYCCPQKDNFTSFSR